MTPGDRDIVNRILVNSAKAMGAYMRLLVSRNAPFDRWVAGDPGALNDSAKRGLKLFLGKAACVPCHSRPAFTDNRFHNLGVPQTGPNVPLADSGRAGAFNGLRGNVRPLAVRLACDVLCVFHGGPDEGDQGGGQNKNNRE